MVILKRLGIFFCYDEDGIIDDYITYILEDMYQNLDDLYVISDNSLTNEGQEKLNKYVKSEVILKVNCHFDALAYRDVMFNVIGFENLSNYDEIVLFNNSFFGPIVSFKTIFNEMDSKNLDFWGITKHGKSTHPEIHDYSKNHDEYIQHYFIVFRKNLFQSEYFKEYWLNIPKLNNESDLIYKHESFFTKYFSDLGYKWDVFVNSDDFDGNIKNAMDFSTFDMYNFISNKNLPIIKINAFKKPRKTHLRYNVASDISKAIDYVKKHSNYDVSLIYKHLLRIMDPSQVVEILNLVKIFPKSGIPHKIQNKKRALLIVHLYYEDLWKYDYQFLNKVPDYIDILITTNSAEKKEFFNEKISKKLINQCETIEINPRGRDMASLLVASRDIVKNYEYFCFMHDKKSQGREYVTTGSTFRDILWENMLMNLHYIDSIIEEFDNNPSVGLMVPPKVFHGKYFYGFVNDYWVQNFDVTKTFLEELGIKTPIFKNYPPLSLGNCFWARYDALKPLFELYLEHDDFPEEPMPIDGTISHAIERSYGYIAASRGYITEIIMNNEFAESEILNYHYMFISLLQSLKSKDLNSLDFYSDYYNLHNTFDNLSIENNSNKKSENKIKKLFKKF